MTCGRIILIFRRHRNVALIIAALSLPAAPCVSGETSSIRVLLLLSGDDGAYEVAADSLARTLLGSAGRALPFDIRKKLVPSDDGSVASYRQLFKEKYDIIVPIGTSASRVVETGSENTPVLNILTTKEAFDAVWLQKGGEPDREVSVIYLEQPFSRQLQFIRLALPSHRSCGVLLGGRSLHLRKILGLAAERNRLSLDAIDITASRTPIDGIRHVTTNNDVILAVPDGQVLSPNVAKWLLYMAYQNGVPVIGFSRAIVEAGALGAVYTTPEQVGRQAAEILLRAALSSMNPYGGVWRLPPAQYPEYFEVAINESVARSLRLQVQSRSYLAQSLHNLERSDSWKARN